MAKIYMNKNDLYNNVTSQLRDSLSHTSSIVNKFNYLGVPGDFSQRQRFFSFEQDMKNINSNLSNFYNWLNDSVKAEKYTEDNCYNYVGLLPSNRVAYRQTIIK